jgi:hypothetical protein
MIYHIKFTSDNCFQVKYILFPLQTHCCLSLIYMLLAGPMWHRPKGKGALLAALRYDASRSRKKKGDLADTLQFNIWIIPVTPPDEGLPRASAAAASKQRAQTLTLV